MKGVSEDADADRSGGPLHDRRIGREMSFARTEWFGGSTAPPVQLNGAERGIGASICAARSLDPPYRVRSSCARYPIFLIMKKYEIEHIGIIVTEPVKMANWYRDVLGFNIKFSAQDHEKAVAFLTDSNDNVMLEFGKVPNVPLLQCAFFIGSGSVIPSQY